MHRTETISRPLGILMLDTTFERPVGDVGNPLSWPFPVLIERVPSATVRRVVGRRLDAGITELFVAAGQSLVDRGAVAITTSCGFLILAQAELARRLPVPVATSALLLLNQRQSEGPPRSLDPILVRAGVITYDAEALTSEHLQCAGADPKTPVAGLPRDGAFRAMIEAGAPYDRSRLEAEVVGTAQCLIAANPQLDAIVLECTNLPPFSDAIEHATGRSVYDALDLGKQLYAQATQAAHA